MRKRVETCMYAATYCMFKKSCPILIVYLLAIWIGTKLLGQAEFNHLDNNLFVIKLMLVLYLNPLKLNIYYSIQYSILSVNCKVFLKGGGVWTLYCPRSDIPSFCKWSWRIRKKSQNQLFLKGRKWRRLSFSPFHWICS